MDAIGVIRVLKSNYVLYAVMFLIFSSSWLYKKMVKELKSDLEIEEEMTHSETWEMVKEISKTDNVKAKIAFVSYFTSSMGGLFLCGLIGLANVDV